MLPSNAGPEEEMDTGFIWNSVYTNQWDYGKSKPSTPIRGSEVLRSLLPFCHQPGCDENSWLSSWLHEKMSPGWEKHVCRRVLPEKLDKETNK